MNSVSLFQLYGPRSLETDPVEYFPLVVLEKIWRVT